MLMSVVEGREARLLSPTVAWPTLLFAAILLPLHLALLGLGIADKVSLWLLTLPLGITSYAHYTLIHESIHGNIVRSRRFAPVNAALGWWGGLLLGTSWPLLRRTHLAHHAHTNGAGDPDTFVHGSLARLFALALLSVGANIVPLPVTARLLGWAKVELGYLDCHQVMSRREWRTHVAVHTLMCVAVWSAVGTGHAGAVFALYVLPATIGRLLIGIFLSWIPHHPFDASDRYKASRIIPSRLLAVLCIGHNMHLIHHLWPRVPFYNYARLYRRLAPVLWERGVTVD